MLLNTKRIDRVCWIARHCHHVKSSYSDIISTRHCIVISTVWSEPHFGDLSLCSESYTYLEKDVNLWSNVLYFLERTKIKLKLEDTLAWSEAIFGNCDLGDKRLTKRLIQIGHQLSRTQDLSLSKSCEGKGALIEGSYRFIRNERVNPSQIADGGYAVTGYLAQTVPLLLAIEDSTSLSYEHSVREELGLTGNNSLAKKEATLFIQQCWWMLKMKKHLD